ncbi:MAG: hypothetical protein RR396_06475 [Clostridiales bacterium]
MGDLVRRSDYKQSVVVDSQAPKTTKYEKEAAISNRFNSLLGEKQFSYEAIKNDYLRKFAGALENENFVGKSDRDIFHELTRDDAGAFLGVQAVRLEGSADFAANDIDEAQVRSVMGLPPLK